MTPRFSRRSDAVARIVPVPAGVAPPKKRRAALAGFSDKPGSVAEVVTDAHRLVLVRCDKADAEAAGALGVARLLAVAHVALDLRGWAAKDALPVIAGAVLRAWRYDLLFTRPDPDRPRIAWLDVITDRPKAFRAAWAALAPVLDGVAFARDLVAEPSNTLTPGRFAERLQSLVAYGLEVEVLGPEALAAGGFGGLLAVGGGSVNPPRLVVLRWKGTIEAAPVAFVGKGVTFDTGGISIKPAAGMWDMRADMAGAAACVGAMVALARRKSPAPAVAVLPLAENAVGAASYRPGDVLRLFDGSTVEIIDTDAEGRLILADALAWAVRTLAPQAVVDLATLTGSIVVALGHHMAGMFATDDVLAAHLAAAGAAVGERVWRMPLAEGYGKALESAIADVKQCSAERMQPDCCLAATFLRRFVGDVPWVHLDIAGTEAREKAEDRHGSGPTGWGVRLLDRLIRERFEDAHRA